MSANATFDISVFRGKEFKHLDAAMLFRTAIYGNPILYGCSISVSNEELVITEGMMVMLGRVGIVHAGSIPFPDGLSSVSSQTTLNVIAVWNLSVDSSNFEIVMVTPSVYQTDYVTQQSNYTDESFNTQQGMRVLLLGTAETIPASNRVLSFTASSTNLRYNNSSVVNGLASRMSTAESSISGMSGYGTRISNCESRISTINDNIRTINNTTIPNERNALLARMNSQYAYAIKRAHAVGKFKAETKSVSGIKVPANGVTTVNFRKEYGSAIYVYSSTASFYSFPQDGHKAEIWITETGTILSEHERNSAYVDLNLITGNVNIDSYGVPVAVINTLTAFGILGVNISGSNACVVGSFGISGNHAYVKIRNTSGSVATSVSVKIRVLHIQTE